MTPETVVKLLSPTQRRIFQPNPEQIAADPERYNRTARALIERGGYRPYTGPAVADARGWVIEGSDPALVPLPPATIYAGIHGRG